ncbi:hypothetical protein Bhyg_11991 [Pseudolycoriella hygida]|uniref:Uncharacterized protein n=1 Tax=Pseudolycoriella hygida TaxID=35572 RepID=A0A9Q0MXZ4_9DIPT|nr:hypothetical protein Bhyg_11991 [Pseudolycoriella hygida]
MGTSIKPSATESMITSIKNVVVESEICSTVPCSESCAPVECQLCRPCLSSDDIQDLFAAHREHLNRGDTKRIFPEPIARKTLDREKLKSLSPKNQMMEKWFYDPSNCKIHIAFISETYLTSDHDFQLTNFSVHRVDRPKPGGGLLIGLQNNIAHKRL